MRHWSRRVDVDKLVSRLSVDALLCFLIPGTAREVLATSTRGHEISNQKSDESVERRGRRLLIAAVPSGRLCVFVPQPATQAQARRTDDVVVLVSRGLSSVQGRRTDACCHSCAGVC
jgi:hypothetical protein